MPHILVIGYAPEAVDFSDPAIPPGLDESVVAKGIQEDIESMEKRGWQADHLPIRPGETLMSDICDRLSRKSFDCIVVGAGVRMTTKHVIEFEQVIAAIREGAPNTPIAFNASPDSSGDAAARWL